MNASLNKSRVHTALFMQALLHYQFYIHQRACTADDERPCKMAQCCGTLQGVV